MNKKLLPLAVLTAVATGGLSTAQAVYVNNNGTGQVLIYPYYSVEGENDTYINIVNTTDQTKAVKVRFLEGMNSQEVLDFNLYLSPRDHWSAMVTESASGGARLVTADEFCTVPDIVGRQGSTVNFREFQYSDVDEVHNGIERTREGYVEIIEMGVVTGDHEEWATHDSSGVPDNCGALIDSWSTGGTWSNNRDMDIAPASGGLSGYGVLINPADGVSAAYDATAFGNFWSAGDWDHRRPGSVLPSLRSGQATAQVIDGNQLYDVTFTDSVDAISATIMQSMIMNDFVLAPEINAGTDWVVNFPTKRFYVFPEPQFAADRPLRPFTTEWDPEKAEACEPIGMDYWDREEREEFVRDVDFSPTPTTDPISLCKEVNVVTFNEANVLYASDRIGHNLDVAFDNGWMQIDFTRETGRWMTGSNNVDETPLTFYGLPTIGFGVQRYTNGDLGGLLANYMGLVNHKAVRDIRSGEAAD